MTRRLCFIYGKTKAKMRITLIQIENINHIQKKVSNSIAESATESLFRCKCFVKKCQYGKNKFAIMRSDENRARKQTPRGPPG